MEDRSLDSIVERSVLIREAYHKLERQLHKKEWTIEEDALAFLTDAGLVGRLTMAQQGRWPNGSDPKSELEHKISECIWWLLILSKRMDINIVDSLDVFLSNLEQQLGRN